MRKVFAIVIGIVLLLTVVLILVPYIINKNEEEVTEITCEFNYDEITNKLSSCLNDAKGKDFSIIINNVILSDISKKFKITYDRKNTTLQLYIDNNNVFSEENINDIKRIQDITIFNNEMFILAYYTKNDTIYDTGNIVGFSDCCNTNFELKDDDSYLVISDILSDVEKGKIKFTKYNYINIDEVLKEDYETSYLGESLFSNYVLIQTETIKK